MPDALDDPLIGAQVGNYQVVAKLGQGGMGAVYLVRHPFLGRELAVKVLADDWRQDPEALARFKREALAANQVGHPAIVEVFDFGALPDGRSYYVMEKLAGRSLREALDRRGRLPADEALALLRPVLEALAAAHAAGIVHRDLKPDNVFLQDDGAGGVRPRLLDFGIAKLGEGGRPSLDGITREGQMLGTPYYLPPEQARGALAEIGPWSDVYALGALLHHALTGSPPFPGRGLAAVILGHLEGGIPSARALEPSVPEALDAVIRRCLAKAPRERFPDAAALLLALDRVPLAAPTAPAGPGAGVLDPALERTLASDPGLAAVTAAGPQASPEPEPGPASTARRVSGPGRGLLGLVAGLLVGVAATALVLLHPRRPDRPAAAAPPADAAVRSSGPDAALAARSGPDAGPPRGVDAGVPPEVGRLRPLAPRPAPPPDLAGPRPGGPRVAPPPDLVPRPGAAAGTDRFAVPQGSAEAHARVHRNRGDLEACYRQAVQERRLRGPVSIVLVVGVSLSGSVRNVNVHPDGRARTALQTCFNFQVLRWVFPTATEDYQVKVPLTFRPE